MPLFPRAATRPSAPPARASPWNLDAPLLYLSAEDAWTTMALVEALFRSSAAPATPLATLPGT